MALIFFPYPLSDGILSLNDASTLCTHCHSPSLPIFQCFLECSQPFVPNHRLLPGFSCDPGPESESTKFYRLQLRLRLRLQRSTPTDSGLDSDSAVLFRSQSDSTNAPSEPFFKSHKCVFGVLALSAAINASKFIESAIVNNH